MTTKKKKETEEMVTGRFPVVTYNAKGVAVRPGEKNTIPTSVADQIEAIHGKFEKTANEAPLPKPQKVADLDDPVVVAAIAEQVEEQTSSLKGQLEKLSEAAGAFVLELASEPVDAGKAEQAETTLKALLDLND